MVQVVFGIFRPHLDSKWRPLFNKGHRWLAVCTFLVAWTAVYLGIRSVTQDQLGGWAAVSQSLA